MRAEKPHNVNVLIQCGGTYQDMEQHEKAIEMFEKAISIKNEIEAT